jgi:hypothetical protein
MKKVLVAGAALMLMSGSAATVHAVHFPTTEPAAKPAAKAEIKPGVVVTGDARVRLFYTDDNYGDFGNSTTRTFRNRDGSTTVTSTGNYNNNDSDQVNMDSRVRLNFKGTAAGGAYAFARVRVQENLMGDLDTDTPNGTTNQDNLWADYALIGIPFSDTFTLEMGKYRSTYGPMAATHNFFYDDVLLTGAKATWKIGGVTVNPFVEWMEESQNYANTSTTVTTTSATGTVTSITRSDTNLNRLEDNDAIRYGVHAKGKINNDWTLGGMLGYQSDERREDNILTNLNYKNEGFFGSLYTSGKAGAFGLIAELAVTDSGLNNFNVWDDDSDLTYQIGAVDSTIDRIGSDDVGFGGYVFPNYQIDKLNIGLNLGFTDGGFTPDRAFGFVMMGSTDNSRISALRIGDTGDWIWGGLIAEYSINEATKLTGNLVYADVDAWSTRGPAGEGPNNGGIAYSLDNAWEVSAVLQYTISKGMDVFFSAGYLQPEFESAVLEDDGVFGALTRFELKF